MKRNILKLNICIFLLLQVMHVTWAQDVENPADLNEQTQSASVESEEGHNDDAADQHHSNGVHKQLKPQALKTLDAVKIGTNTESELSAAADAAASANTSAAVAETTTTTEEITTTTTEEITSTTAPPETTAIVTLKKSNHAHPSKDSKDLPDHVLTSYPYPYPVYGYNAGFPLYTPYHHTPSYNRGQGHPYGSYGLPTDAPTEQITTKTNAVDEATDRKDTPLAVVPFRFPYPHPYHSHSPNPSSNDAKGTDTVQKPPFAYGYLQQPFSPVIYPTFMPPETEVGTKQPSATPFTYHNPRPYNFYRSYGYY